MVAQRSCSAYSTAHLPWSVRGTAAEFHRRDLAAAAAAADSALRSLAAHGLPRFSVPAVAVRLMHTPTELHDELLRSALGARRRVRIASLYLGSGPLETSVVEAVTTSQMANPNRQLSLLVDYHRARRKGALSLVSRIAHAPNARVDLLASPAAPAPGSISACGGLGGVLSEVRGVQHAKLAIFDDTVLFTGANLSEEYLSTRQDRYMLLSDVPQLAGAAACSLSQLGTPLTPLPPLLSLSLSLSHAAANQLYMLAPNG